MDNFKLLSSYKTNVPRYTSYPTAPHFIADVGQKYLGELHRSVVEQDQISLYIHIPFCDRLCWFCGCHTKQTNHYAPVSQYVETLIKEIMLHSDALKHRPKLAHIHFGGGSPSMLKSTDFAAISHALNHSFLIDKTTEISVEIDPNDMSVNLMDGLKVLGITRASIGVQDFNPNVQQAINRPQTFEQTKDLIVALRKIGVNSINIDALYGLPRQNINRLQSTIEQVISLEPDRIAMFGYAHVPWVKTHQKMISDEDLPNSYERFKQMQLASKLLVKSGLIKIGIDHFSKPNDSLALAQKNRTLHRNFQGYTTDNSQILLGLGASSISKFENGYIQNLVPTNLYKSKISDGHVSAARGYYLNLDDRIRAYIIEQLMCYFKVSFDDLINQFGGKALPFIAFIKSLKAFDQNNICTFSEGQMSIKPEHLPLTRIVASWFDAYLDRTPFKYSKAV